MKIIIKYLLASFATILTGHLVSAQYDVTGDYKISGDVGIGVSAPVTKLHVHGESVWLTGGAGFGLGAGAGKGLRLYYHDTNDYGVIFSYDYGVGDWKNLIINPNAVEGNVGIGTNAPQKRLDVNGNVMLGRTGKSGRIDFRRSSDGASGGSIGFAGETENQNFRLTSHGGSGVISFWTNGGGTTEKMRITPGGNVGIGTTNPGSFKLAVNGNIRAKEVKIETGWFDFVFEDDYDLPTLGEVEEFIKANKHLPEIPSAQEVAENGVNLGEMESKLLQKIEELTLYIIEQEKRIKKLEAGNSRLVEVKKQ